MLFPKAGVDASKAWIPGVNFAEWCKLIGRKPSYAWWLLIPIVNIFIFTGMAVDLVRSFNKLGFKDTALAVIFAPLKFWMTAKDEKAKYEGPILDREKAYMNSIKEAHDTNDSYNYKKLVENNPFKKTGPREWVESVVFAVFAAAFIRMFLIEAYVIPTPSMEGSLNVGDFLFVSKAHYGIRTPSTIAMIPLLHNRIPFINKESYLEKPSIKSYRLPAFEKIEVGKPIVFNWPVGDSIYLTASRSYAVMQIENEPDMVKADPGLLSLVRNKEIITRPVDKRDHYIKRCLGVAGDTLQIINAEAFINGQLVPKPKNLQFRYVVSTPPTLNLPLKKMSDWKIEQSVQDISPFGESIIMADTIARRVGNGVIALERLSTIDNQTNKAIYRVAAQRQLEPQEMQNELSRLGLTDISQFQRCYLMVLTDEQREKVQALDKGVNIAPYDVSQRPSSLFPFTKNDWTVDNFGPIWIPKAGVTVPINMDNIALYTRIINVYEDNDFEIKGGRIFINSTEANEYTFKQDYYWAMGDNRHNSEDSRMWGFVPHDHIVGKPLFIWFSTKEGSIGNGINWDRIFKSATSKQ